MCHGSLSIALLVPILIGTLQPSYGQQATAARDASRPAEDQTPEQDAGRPNILFAIADDWGLHAGAYATPWIETPGFDQIAREGILFHHAYTPNAKCAPSRAIILTGRHSWQLEQAGNHLAYFPAKFQSYPETLAGRGYFVGVTGKGWGPGIANDQQGAPREIVGRSFDQHRAEPPTEEMTSTDYASNFEAFLDANSASQPWCFWYGAREPHRPYEYGSGIQKGGKRLDSIVEVPDHWPDNELIRNDMLDYAFEVEHFDRHLVRMLKELDRRGMSDNTLVVVTSDHGMPFPRVKSHAYLDSNHVPLAIRWPGGIRSPGRTVDDFVSFTDLAPTFLDVAGIPAADSGMAEMTGTSLRALFESDNSAAPFSQRRFLLVGKERHDAGRPNDVGYPIRGILTKRFLYLKNYEPDRWPAGNPETGYLATDGCPTKTWILEARRQDPDNRFWQLNFGKRPLEELYDLGADPHCIQNLIHSSEHQHQRKRLHQLMTETLRDQGDPRMFGRGKVFDTYPITSDNSRGFYDRYLAGEETPAPWVNETDFEPEPLD